MPELLSKSPVIGPDERLVVGCLRNERLRLPDFLAHHRCLGVHRFLLIDNDSDDGSVEFMEQQEDVCLFHTSKRYSDSECGVTWLNAVLAEYAAGHWVLVLDIDELFIFPGFENTRLDAFTNYISGLGSNAVFAPMLDMYSDRPFGETNYRAGTSLIKAAPYFDGDGYQLSGPQAALPGLPMRGGPRHRLFWQKFNRAYPSPVLAKIPLIKWQQDFSLEASTHVLQGGKIAATTGMLLHFKLLQDFAQNAAQEATRKEHFRDARQYAAYHEVLSSASDLSAYCEKSLLFESSAQLLRLGLMRAAPDYPYPISD